MTRPQTDWIVRKRDGRVSSFDLGRIERAMENAIRAELNLADKQPLDSEMQGIVKQISQEVAEQIAQSASSDQGVGVEEVQDAVELGLMKHGQYRVARRYIVYRAEHAKLRALRGEISLAEDGVTERVQMHVTFDDGTKIPFDSNRIHQRLAAACDGLESTCSVSALQEEVLKSIYDGITTREIYRAMILAARSRIERDPDYDIVAARLMLNVIYHDALGSAPSQKKLPQVYRNQFEHYVIDGITAERLSPGLRDFNLTEIADALRPERDTLFQYLGLQTIYDRYLIHVDGRRIETPQYFWMRVAMGLAVNEGEDKEQRAIEFYNMLSSMRFTSATPTLFNSATLHPQLSSCYLSTVSDDLEHIFKVISDNAKLSKWAGGLGNDWSNIRATNAHIHGTNGQSQGVIPFLKVVNDTAVAVNQGGKRKGAVCAYLETWHLDIEDFLDLRKNTGDDRRRTHDMHTANWIPDLFMKRVQANEEWTLFSPDDVPDLHDLMGSAFEERYRHYEKLAADGEMEMFRKVSAVELWRKMLTRLFETGHPWITWKDPSNVRSPQDHCGVVHSSNLCTEILLNTSKDETAVCNLGSINLKNHIVNGQLDLEMLRETTMTAMRMLDNVIDINYYPTPEAKRSNQRHRPVGLGLMGFQDALLAMGLSYSSDEAVEFADRSMEAISYYAILASSELAKERGKYSSYDGSKWDRGLLPIDTLDVLEQERGEALDVDRSASLDWTPVRESVAKYGMRNSNCMAIAPTATISTIIGVSQSIEPSYKHLYVKSNLSGEFTQVNTVLVKELKSRHLWDDDMLDALKYYDGALAEIDRIPADVKVRYQTAFEVEPYWLIECAARRQKWIDMGQSLNLYMQAPSGKKLNDMYIDAWKKGLKTTYYLRSLAATQVEKSTVDVNKFGIQPRWMKNKSASGDIRLDRGHAATETPVEIPATMVGQTCDPDNPDCEACQ
ncbi:ribonucleoside-diphosphate reductase subunit alpha [Rubinisphaera margarita]|uniref:ribonucleoside-diphosphate reductase subunit alpha n=1 Tax=Rubinisphaera margarita TaxID=2909586 RepID=UPI001EE7FEFF|nr:ribonucleoside-diphosphate reductase subunit alpha [Rubinisphaera margarita]MCG6156712.1 ribonucleoside-diphosphate reductase subunit alpha [Rubinisphaera margarita]